MRLKKTDRVVLENAHRLSDAYCLWGDVLFAFLSRHSYFTTKPLSLSLSPHIFYELYIDRAPLLSLTACNPQEAYATMVYCVCNKAALLISLLSISIVRFGLASVVSTGDFNTDFHITWSPSHVNTSADGHSRTLMLDQESGT